MIRFGSPLCITSLLLALTSALPAQEVTLQHGELKLNANLALAEDKTIRDGMLLLVHGTLAHNRMEIIATLQELLQEAGINSLAINLSLGVDDRHGMYDCKTPHTHRHEDAVDEIGAWLRWLAGQGAADVVLAGHSRGGNQAAWYAAEHPGARLKALVLIAPAARAPGAEPKRYQKRFGKPLAPVLREAKSRIAAHEGAATLQPVDFLYCADTAASASAFVSYHAEEARMNTPALVPRIDMPVLVIVGSEDQVVKGLEKKFAPFSDRKNVRILVIDGADHFFRDLYAEEAVEAVAEFLEE